LNFEYAIAAIRKVEWCKVRNNNWNPALSRGCGKIRAGNFAWDLGGTSFDWRITLGPKQEFIRCKPFVQGARKIQ
jgi:hypothetical protein